ncbi:MAG: efflux RND transporter periplasmic adaptor subunit, partial [Patescibacteria group bacterium]
MNKNVLIVAGILVVVLGGGIAGTAYIAAGSKTVSIDKAQIEAPVITLSSTQPGLLRHTYVTVGQRIPAGTVVAQVGVELIKATQGGLVLSARTDLGSALTPQDAVVTMIDPSLLRVVGQVQEDKGLADINVGDVATFTVDAFGSKKFDGVVDEVSPSS